MRPAQKAQKLPDRRGHRPFESDRNGLPRDRVEDAQPGVGDHGRFRRILVKLPLKGPVRFAAALDVGFQMRA
jgi:hypothetical protein